MLRNGYYGKYKDKIYPITILQNKGIVYVMSNNLDDLHKGFEKIQAIPNQLAFYTINITKAY